MMVEYVKYMRNELLYTYTKQSVLLRFGRETSNSDSVSLSFQVCQRTTTFALKGLVLYLKVLLYTY